VGQVRAGSGFRANCKRAKEYRIEGKSQKGVSSVHRFALWHIAKVVDSQITCLPAIS
jgi:hypothetical protein